MTPTIPRPSVLEPAGPLGEALADIGLALTASASVVFVVVLGLLWIVLRARPPGPEREPGAAPAVERRLALRWIIGGGVAFPVIVLSSWLALSTGHVAGFVSDGRRIATDSRTLVVSVDARMWWWRIRYAAADGGRDVVVAANELRLPAGRPVRLALASDDVIHSFWVPALAGKVDMVPGRIHHIELDGLPPGIHRGQCAEFCGEQHARMAMHVVIEPAEAFDRWLAGQREPAAAPADPQAERGLVVFRESRCDGCHQIRGVTGTADDGPDLTHVGTRLHLGAGTLRNDAPGRERWLVDLQRIKSGARMPSYQRLPPDDRAALAHYLGSLR